MYKFAGIIFFLIIITGCAEKDTKYSNNAKPNIVFIFADDLTYSAVNSLGNKEVITPNIDRLVHSGTTFTNAYNMGSWSGAVCAASRAMIISGRSVWKANEFRQNWLKGEGLDKTWGKIMETNGYDTYMTGKWHVDVKAKDVFKNVVHVRPGMPSDAWNHEEMQLKFKKAKEEGTSLTSLMPEGYNRPLSKTDTTWTPTNLMYEGYWQGGKHWSEVLKEDAIRYIKKANNIDNPFFMYLSFNAPHDPRQAPQEYLDKYEVENISLPKSWLPEYPYKDSIGNSPTLRDEALLPFPRTPYATKKNIQEYYALITHLDDQIGAILDTLEESGKMDNTYIIFTADHGLALGRHGLFGKQSLFDHSIRAPFIIMGPNIPKGEQISTDIYLQDAMATSIDLAGAEKPHYVEFNSVLNLVKGKQDKSYYPAIYGCYLDLQRMIRKDGYKLLVYPKLNKILLFNLEEDPEEMYDIAEDPKNKEKVRELFKELLKLQIQMRDTLNLSKIYTTIQL